MASGRFTPTGKLAEALHQVNEGYREYVEAHLFGDTPAEFLSATLTAATGVYVSPSTIRTQRRLARIQEGVCGTSG